MLQETRHLALRTLRELMVSAENRVRIVATTTFVRYDLALKRHGAKEAESRLERDTSPRGRQRMTADLDDLLAQNTSESTEVKNEQHVAAPKTAAQSGAQRAPQTTAATAATSASAATTPPAPAKTAPPAQPKPAATIAAAPAARDERERRKRVLLNDFALGRSARPLGKDDRLDREVERIVDGMLADAKVDDAPPG
jgi:hypothetical protein